jgi:outer membrane protein assembly factor BamA
MKDNADKLSLYLGALCGLAFLLISASAQTSRKLTPKDLPPSAFKLVSIKVTGTKRYQPDDVIAASGLQIGATVSEDDFRKTARQLGESGAFTNVAYSFQYSTEGTKLELQVQDSDKFVPVRFENLVWFSEQELLDQLHSRVPLFHGDLPVAGNLVDDLSEALQAMVTERKIEGRIDYLRVAHEDGPVEAFSFSISGPQITIRNVEFTGAGTEELPALQAAGKKFQGAVYVRSAIRVQEDKSFLPVYFERGYIRAKIGDPQPKVVQDNSDETLVDVTFPVEPGGQYTLGAIEIAGYKTISAESLRPLIHGQMGQPANTIQLQSDLEAIKRFYGMRGYMAALVRWEPEFDDARSWVNYRIFIKEGDVYKMGDLDIQGLDSKTTARLQNDWTLRGGDTYDSSYPRRFTNEALKQVLTMGDWNTDIHETVSQRDKTVDVTIRFDPKR